MFVVAHSECPNCGCHSTDSDDKFCAECGTPLVVHVSPGSFAFLLKDAPTLAEVVRVQYFDTSGELLPHEDTLHSFCIGVVSQIDSLPPQAYSARFLFTQRDGTLLSAASTLAHSNHMETIEPLNAGKYAESAALRLSSIAEPRVEVGQDVHFRRLSYYRHELSQTIFPQEFTDLCYWFLPQPDGLLIDRDSQGQPYTAGRYRAKKPGKSEIHSLVFGSKRVFTVQAFAPKDAPIPKNPALRIGSLYDIDSKQPKVNAISCGHSASLHAQLHLNCPNSNDVYTITGPPLEWSVDGDEDEIHIDKWGILTAKRPRKEPYTVRAKFSFGGQEFEAEKRVFVQRTF